MRFRQEGDVVRQTQERETPLPLELSKREQTKVQEIPPEPNVYDKKWERIRVSPCQHPSPHCTGMVGGQT